MSRSPVTFENGRAAEPHAAESQSSAVLAATLRALLVARRRVVISELTEIETRRRAFINERNEIERLLEGIGVT